MEATDKNGPDDVRLPYEPPRIEEELEFETAALAGCALTSGFSCEQGPGLKLS